MAVAVALFGGMLWATARRWRYLAANYAEPRESPIEKRIMQSVVLLGLGGVNTLKGIVTISVHRSGVSFRVMPPFSLFHDPIFVPFNDIQGFQTSWYIDAPSTELAFRRAPDVKVVMPADQAEWMMRRAVGEIHLHDTPPPSGKAGQGWRWFFIVHAAYALISMATLLVVYVNS